MESKCTYVVAVHLVDQAYGGPEEGGWWYQVGSLVRTVKVLRSEERAYEYCRKLNGRLKSREFGPNAGRRSMSSVLSEGEYWADVYENTAPKHYPESRPHYD